MAVIDEDVRRLINQLLESPLSWLGREIMTEVEGLTRLVTDEQLTREHALTQLRIFERRALEVVKDQRAMGRAVASSASELGVREVKILWEDEGVEDILGEARQVRLSDFERAIKESVSAAEAAIAGRYP